MDLSFVTNAMRIMYIVWPSVLSKNNDSKNRTPISFKDYMEDTGSAVSVISEGVYGVPK